MSDLTSIFGFEEDWLLSAASPRGGQRALLQRGAGDSASRGRLVRIANGAPEVVVKVSGNARGGRQLRAHLQYISRKGELEMEDSDGAVIVGRSAVNELAGDWSAAAEIDSLRQSNTPFSQSMVLSMPAATDASVLRDAARAFAIEAFSNRFDYVSVLHTDAEHPHVHMVRRWLGGDGRRFNPNIGDLQNFRRIFAQALRDRGVEAEATPRWSRGVTRKTERSPLRRIRQRYEVGDGPAANSVRAAYHEAARAAFLGEAAPTPWERRMIERQAKIRNLYLARAEQLARSADPADQALGAKVEAFVRAMPPPDSQRLALARELRAANDVLRRQRDKDNERER